MIRTLSFIVLLFTFVACQQDTTEPSLPIMWHGSRHQLLPQMEASGYTFYNDQGEPEDCFKILKDHGINSIRLRTWVNPSDHPTVAIAAKKRR